MSRRRCPCATSGGRPCAHVLLDDGSGVLRLVEHAESITVPGVFEDVELDRVPGSLLAGWPAPDARGLVRAGDALFGLYARDDVARIGVRTPAAPWREVALPDASLARIAATDDGALVAWVGRGSLEIGHLTSGATGEVELVSEASFPVVTEADGAVSLVLSGGPRAALLVSDAAGSSFLGRREPPRTWRIEQIASGERPRCGEPSLDATCEASWLSHRALALTSSDDGMLFGVIERVSGHEMMVGVPTEPEAPYPFFDAGVALPPYRWSVTSSERAREVHWLVAGPDDEPRAVPSPIGPLARAELELDAHGAMHVFAGDAAGLRYVRLSAR